MWCRCSESTLYPDGAVRCDSDLKLALEECTKIIIGAPKIYQRVKFAKSKITKKSLKESA